MGECRGGDCLIKLFGKTIPVPESGAGTGDVEKDLQHSGSTTIESKVQENAQQDSTDTAPQPEGADTDDSPAAKNSSTDEEQAGDTGNQKEKLKKPDKILPCPRCSSMDTKFCYYNNYNINQPRHFCKNCQRYWTAGGAMRNVPVGAGRRKSKSAAAASHFLQRVRAALPGDPLCPPIKTNGTVLSFGSDTATLDLGEQMAHLGEKIIPICRSWNADDPSIGSCTEGSNNGEDKNQMDIKEKVTVEKPAKAVQHPCMNGGAMWPYGCAPSPAYYTSSIAIPFYPAAAYWGCMVPGAWGVSVAPQSQSQAALSPNAASSVSSGPNSLTLGKHPRDDGKEGNHGNCNGNGKVWAPKTVRINDVDEVARSSIWTLIGIKGDKASTCTHGRKLARVFEPKGEAKTAARAVINSSPLLHANPVALSRSVTFQEGC